MQWLGEQFDEDERTVRATVWDGSGNKLDWELMASATIDVGGDEFYVGDRTIANHMMAWQPARVLHEINAKRDLLRFAKGIHDHHETFTTGVAARLEETLRLYALAYAARLPGGMEAVSEIAEFLRARIAERRALAEAASPGPWRANEEADEVVAVDGITVADGFALSGRQLRATVQHIAANDPTDVINDLDAKLALIDDLLAE